MPDPTTMEEIDQHIVQHLDESLHDLSVLCHQPSVAAQQYGIQDCAELLASQLRTRGWIREDARIVQRVTMRE